MDVGLTVTATQQLFIGFLGITLLGGALYGGWTEGDRHGHLRANAQRDARKDEHDRIMQKIGTCKWAKIVAEDIRCKQELP